MPQKQRIVSWLNRSAFALLAIAAILWIAGITASNAPNDLSAEISPEEEYQQYQKLRRQLQYLPNGYDSDLQRGSRINAEIEAHLMQGAIMFEPLLKEQTGEAAACFETFLKDIDARQVDEQRANLEPEAIQSAQVDGKTYYFARAPRESSVIRNVSGFFAWDANTCSATRIFGFQAPRRLSVSFDRGRANKNQRVVVHAFIGEHTSYRAYINPNTKTVHLLNWVPDGLVRASLNHNLPSCVSTFVSQFQEVPEAHQWIRGYLPAECIRIKPHADAFRLSYGYLPLPDTQAAQGPRRYSRSGQEPFEESYFKGFPGGDLIDMSGIDRSIPWMPSKPIEDQILTVFKND